MRTIELWGFWTEHDNVDTPGWMSRAPGTCEIAPLYAGSLLVPCGETPSAFVLRWVGTEGDCKDACTAMETLGWVAYLADWEKRQRYDAEDHVVSASDEDQT
jgi:hypothetical protein